MNFICIEGNIGAGKTTLSKKIANHFNYEFLPEQFENNTLLPLFYHQPDKYAYTLEFSFLIDRFQQLMQWKGTFENKHVISDYHFYKCLCFAKVNLSDKQFQLFEYEFFKLNELVKQPNLIIHLKLNTKNLLDNILNRNRNSESLISKDYLIKINESYDYVYSDLNSMPTINFYLNENINKTYELVFDEIIEIINSGFFKSTQFHL